MHCPLNEKTKTKIFILPNQLQEYVRKDTSQCNFKDSISDLRNEVELGGKEI